MVCVCGSVAWGTADDESDIDFCIVVRPGRIWSTRFVIAGILEVFGLRPRPGKTRDQLCTSFFVTEDALNLSPLALRDDAGEIDDPLLAKWIATMHPIVDRDDMFQKFQRANRWGNPPSPSLPFSRGESEDGFFGNWFERLAKHYQLSHLHPRIAEESSKPDTNVVLSDTILKLHTNDRREEYRRKYYA